METKLRHPIKLSVACVALASKAIRIIYISWEDNLLFCVLTDTANHAFALR